MLVDSRHRFIDQIIYAMQDVAQLMEIANFSEEQINEEIEKRAALLWPPEVLDLVMDRIEEFNR